MERSTLLSNMCKRSIQLLAASFLASTTVVGQSSAINLQVSHARPLEAALDELEKRLAVPINYEDPRFLCPDELQDITAQVQSPAQKAANPRRRPRGLETPELLRHSGG